MNKNGPIIVIEDDEDDQLLLQLIYDKMDYSNELIFLKNGEVAIEYFGSMTKIPFIIVSDINIPIINGIELRAKVRSNVAINIKCIPYILLSTTVSKEFIDNAYLLGVQGYFKKPADPHELEELFQSIIAYWKKSFAPGMYM